MDIDQLKEVNVAVRLEELERRIRVSRGPESDFTGTVTGYWVRLDQNAGGVVEYNGKEYISKPLGWTTIKPGTPVALTAAGGIYYSNW